MPIRNPDPFVDPLENLDLAVNIYAKLLEENQKTKELPIFYSKDLQDKAGNWLATLNERNNANASKLILEIGCHNGDTTLDMALDHEDAQFLGIDITFKRIIKTAKKSKKTENNNMSSMLCNAVALDKVFSQNEVDGIVLFFPDPWLKKKSQLKNRLLNEAFAEKCFKVLKPNGFFWFKTDHKPYYEEGASTLLESGFVPCETNQVFPYGKEYLSCFQKKFTEKKLPYYEGRWIKP